MLPYMPYIWLAATVIFVLVEAGTLGLTSIWFAFGSLAALAASLLHFGIPVQLAFFLLAAGILLTMIRPVTKKYLRIGTEKTNADRIIGMKGIVLQPIDNQAATGQVRVGGQIWTARSQDPTVTYLAGSEVTIRAISGVKVIVSQ